MTAFKTQQARWAKGLIQTGKKILPKVFKSKAPFRVKVEAFYHLSANLSYPLMIVLSTLLMPAMIIRSFGGWFQMLVIDLPLFLASTFSISSFYLVSQKELFPRRWPRTFLFLPFLMALGIGLTLTNTRAVIEALLGIKSSFKRTPKYAVQSKADKAQGQKYRRRLGHCSVAGVAGGNIFCAHVRLRFQQRQLLDDPVPAAFCAGILVHGIDVIAARAV